MVIGAAYVDWPDDLMKIRARRSTPRQRRKLAGIFIHACDTRA
jgi:hypothetical protein